LHFKNLVAAVSGNEQHEEIHDDREDRDDSDEAATARGHSAPKQWPPWAGRSSYAGQLRAFVEEQVSFKLWLPVPLLAILQGNQKLHSAFINKSVSHTGCQHQLWQSHLLKSGNLYYLSVPQSKKKKDKQ
jgi:hypothetical protein